MWDKRHAGLASWIGIAGFALALVSCASVDKTAESPARPALKIPAYNAASRPIVEAFPRVDGPLEASAPLLLVRERLKAARRSGQNVEPAIVNGQEGELRHIKYSAVNATADQVVRALVGELLGRNYIVEQSIATQRVNIDIDDEMTDADLDDVLHALAMVYGWSVEERGAVTVVAPAASMARLDATPIIEARAAFPSQRVAARVYRMKYLPVTQAQSVCQPLMSPGGAIIVAGRSLVIVDRTSQLNRLGDVLAALDKPAFDGVEIWTYRLRHQPPEQASRVLDAIGQAAGLSTGGDALATFVPVGGTDRLMVVSRDPTIQPIVQRWLAQVDQPYGESGRQRYLYRIQSYDPAQLEHLLATVFAGKLAPPTAPPGDSRMRLIMAPEEDLMVIEARPSDYADLLAFLKRVDRSRQQVLLQTVIAEVSLKNTLQWGVDYFLQTKTGEGALDLTGSALALGPAAPTGAVAFTAADGFAVLQALDSESDVTILDAPTLMATDKGESTIQVGAEVPVLRASLDSNTQTGGTSGIRNEVQYRDTGVILTAQPRVNESGNVSLHLRLEITDAVPNSTSGIDSPEFTKRVVETDVTVPHGRTLLIGGIRSRRDIDRAQKVPFLGDVPAVGAVFSNIDREKEATELLIAITPNIVSNPHEAASLVSDFVASSDELKTALLQFADALPRPLALEVRSISSPDAAKRVPPPKPGDDAPSSGPASFEGEPRAVMNLRQLASNLPAQGDDAAFVASFLRSMLIRAEAASLNVTPAGG